MLKCVDKHRKRGSDFISISLLSLMSLSIALSNTNLQLSSGQSSMYANDFRMYSDIDQRINIEYPSDWIINSPSIVGCNLCIVVFDSPVANSKGNQVAELRVGIDSSSPARDLQSYLNNVIRGYQNNPGSRDFALLRSDIPATLSGLPALAVLFQHKDISTNVLYTVLEIATFIDNKFYFIYASTDADQFQAYSPSLKKMINSLQISEAGNTQVRGDTSARTYEIPNYGLRMTIPTDWNQVSPPTDQYPRQEIAEFQKDSGAIRLSYFNTGDVPMETYTSQMISGIRNIPQVTVDTISTQMEVSGIPAGLVTYQQPDTDGSGRILSIFDGWIKHGNQGYLHFAFIASDLQTYNNLAPSAIDIVKSVQVLGIGDTGSSEQPVIGSEPPQCGGSSCIAADRGPPE